MRALFIIILGLCASVTGAEARTRDYPQYVRPLLGSRPVPRPALRTSPVPDWRPATSCRWGWPGVMCPRHRRWGSRATSWFAAR